MKRHTFKKRMISAVLSGAMLLSCAAMPLSTMSASAAVWINSDFDDGVGLPWHVVETSPARAEFSISDGSYNIMIIHDGGVSNGGEGRYSLQFRAQKLQMVAGRNYHIHAELTSDQDGEIFARIGDVNAYEDLWHNSMGGTEKAVGYEPTEDIGQSWETLKVKAGEKLVIDANFIPQMSMENAVWAFEFGGEGMYQQVPCFPVGTTLKFDNMYMEDDSESTDPPPVEKGTKPFAVNQLGYLPDKEKIGILHSDEAITAKDFYLMDAETDKSVLKGALSGISSKADTSSGQYTASADFSSVLLPGKYYLSLDGKSHDSCTFEIGKDVYEGVMTDAVNYFYQNRAGMGIDAEYITSTGANENKLYLAHAKSDTFDDKGYVQNQWIKTYARNDSIIKESGIEHTASGGWYEAESHAKSVINGANAVWMLQNLYERNAVKGEEYRFSEECAEIVTPENKDRIPNILNETKYELDFLMSMMIPEGTEYELKQVPGAPDLGADTKKYAGMLYHQIQDSMYTGLAVHSWDYIECKEYQGIQRVIKPPTTNATLAAAAVFAQASRLFKMYDEAYANKLLSCAETAYKAAKANPALYPAYEAAVSSRTTGDSDVTDDFYWAACELYLTKEDPYYLDELEAASNYAYRLDTILNGGENAQTPSSFNWGSTGGYGSLSLVLHPEMLSEKNLRKLKDSIAEAADYYLKLEEKDVFSVPYQGGDFAAPIGFPSSEDSNYSGYENDSNGIITNNAIVLAYAYDQTSDAKYYQGAVTAMDYIFGRNPMDTSYVTGYGENSAVNPHHKFWAHEVDSDFPYAPSGVMVSGPNSRLNDQYVQGMGMKRGEVAAQCCYIDSIEAWSVNSCSLTLNASLAWMTGFLSQGEAEPEYEMYDLNGDNKCTVADAVTMEKVLTGETTLTYAMYKAADGNHDNKINAIDLTNMKRHIIFEASLPSSLPN